MVLICWDLGGNRSTETLPMNQLRRRRHHLESLGAVIYWSERLVNA